MDYKNNNNKFFKDNTFSNNIDYNSPRNRNFLSHKSIRTSSIVNFDIL